MTRAPVTGAGMRRWVPAAAALALALAFATAADAVPALGRGVNLSHWLQYGGRQQVTAEDVEVLARAGFDHVRLPVDPQFLGWTPTDGALDGSRLRAAVSLALAGGLDVIVDLHLDEDAREALEKKGREAEVLAGMWRQMVAALAGLPPDRLAFELMNEPQYYDWGGAARWRSVQRQLARGVRAEAPGVLLLLGGRLGGSVGGLAELEPLDDPLTAYAFHFYDPHLFTHQGAEWMADDPHTAAARVRGLPYPAGLAVDRQGMPERAEYRREGWDGARIRAAIEPAAQWARRHSVRVVCSEFGVLRAHADPASRHRWLADVRRALEENGVGWTVWDYADIFGIAAGSGPGTPAEPRHLEPAALRALGLDG